MEIIVVLAWQRLSSDYESIKFTRKLHRVRFRSRPRNPLFQQHPEILSATRQSRPLHGVRRSCRRFLSLTRDQTAPLETPVAIPPLQCSRRVSNPPPKSAHSP